MLTAMTIIGSLAITFGLILGFAQRKFRIDGNPIVDQIEDLLPQTQCGQCSYPGCHPYAEAIANDEADINRCPPGGDDTIAKLADLLEVDIKPLDEESGEIRLPSVALINEQTCIGCTLCIQACPVDAILGASKQMHSVIDVECTGCELCLPPCPVDCITMETTLTTVTNWQWPAVNQHHETL